MIGLTWNSISSMDGSRTEVPSPYLLISEVPSAIQNKQGWKKNKVVKTQRPKGHLAIKPMVNSSS